MPRRIRPYSYDRADGCCPAAPIAPTQPHLAQRAPINPALAWNVVIIVAGIFIAVIGLGAWLIADPSNSAFRQTVAALWLIAGLLGLVITAIGVLGVSLVYTLRQQN
jgi:hypothetical protein